MQDPLCTQLIKVNNHNIFISCTLQYINIIFVIFVSHGRSLNADVDTQINRRLLKPAIIDLNYVPFVYNVHYASAYPVHVNIG